MHARERERERETEWATAAAQILQAADASGLRHGPLYSVPPRPHPTPQHADIPSASVVLRLRRGWLTVTNECADR